MDGTTAVCTVQGPMRPLLQALATTTAVNLATRDPSLEELFLRVYRAGQRDDG